MQYAEIETPARRGLVAMEPTNFGLSYKELDDQTDESGWEEWTLYSYNDFNNEFAQADEARYAQRGWWGVNFRDRIKAGEKGVDNNGRLDVVYVSHSGLKFEKTYSGIWAPKEGFIVPTNDGMFHEGTLVPFETVGKKDEAILRLEAKGIPIEQISYFWRPENYDSERFVGRDFSPDLDVIGRFSVDAGGLPSDSGLVRVASRPAYSSEPEIILRVSTLPKGKETQ